MRASARIVARCQPDGVTRLTTLAGEAPLLLRRTGALRPGQDTARPDAAPDPAWGAARRADPLRPPAQVHLVGGAAGPLGGDELRCLVDLGPGARLEVRSVAASVALPGPHGRESSLEIHARVGEGGALRWSPQPLIAARGARHRTMTRVELAADALLVWREELVLGRDGEEPGSICTRLRVVRDGQVLLDHEISLGPRHPGSLGPSGTGGHRALGTVLFVDPAWAGLEGPAAGLPGAPRLPAQDDKRVAIAALRLSGPAVLVTAAAVDGLALGRVLDGAVAQASL